MPSKDILIEPSDTPSTTNNTTTETAATRQTDNTHQAGASASMAGRRAFVVTLAGPNDTSQECDRLAHTLGLVCVASTQVRRRGTNHATFFGPGQTRTVHEEITAFASAHPARAPELVLVDAQLTPRQERALERIWELPVMDRTQLILQIFAERARTREAKLEVELATLRHQLPRVRDEGDADDRRGGGGRGERGHTNAELEKLRIRKRIGELQSALATQQSKDDARRDARATSFQVALVGYTNAGKSTLLRALTGAEVLVEDKLFATVGTTTRRLSHEGPLPIVVSDTVGFVRALPHELVASFRSTLEEARGADLRLVVVDASDPAWPAQLSCVRETLAEDGEPEGTELLVFNKIDAAVQADPDARAVIEAAYPEAIIVSAHTPDDVRSLHAAVVAAQRSTLVEAVVRATYTHGQLIGEIHREADVVAIDHDDTGITAHVYAAPAIVARWRAHGVDVQVTAQVDA